MDSKAVEGAGVGLKCVRIRMCHVYLFSLSFRVAFLLDPINRQSASLLPAEGLDDPIQN